MIKKFTKINHGDYLNYDVPDGWVVESDDELTQIYNDNGKGTMTISFYSNIESSTPLVEQITVMAKKFIDQNEIKLHKPLIVNADNKDKTILYGVGTTADNWFLKLWVVARSPKIVFATYQSKKRSSEVKIYDGIIESMNFTIE